MSIRSKGWLSENITSLLALIVTIFGCYMFRLILLKEVASNDNTTNNIITSYISLMIFCLGFYFGASHKKESFESTTKDNKIEEVKTEN